MKIVKVKLFGDRRRKTEVVLNSNSIAWASSRYQDLYDDDLCDKLLNIILEDTSEIKFDSITFTKDFDDCENNDPWRTYTLKTNINYNDINMVLELTYGICSITKYVHIRLCDPNYCGCIGSSYTFSDNCRNVDDDFITQLINIPNIDYYLDSEKVDEDSFKLYCALNA